MQVGLQSRTLRVARDLPEAELLAGELLNFQVKVTAAAHDWQAVRIAAVLFGGRPTCGGVLITRYI